LKYTAENRDRIQRKWQQYWMMNIVFNLFSLPFLCLGVFSIIDYTTSDINLFFLPAAIAFGILILLIFILLNYLLTLFVVRAVFRKRHPDVKLFQDS